MIKVAKVVGLNSDTTAALALTSQKEQLLFCAIISCECEDAFTKVRQTLSLTEEVFYSSSATVSQRLPEVFKEARNFLQDSKKIEIELAAIVEDDSGTVLYLLTSGDNLTAYLLRGNDRNNLSDLSRGDVVSGVIQEGDRILLCTQSLLEFYGHKLDLLGQIPLESFEDEITLKLPEAQANPIAIIVLEREKSILEDNSEEQLQELETPVTRERSFKVPKVPVETFQEIPQLVLNVLKKIAPRSKKGFFLLGIVLLALSLGGTFLNYQNQKRLEKDNQFNSALNRAKEQLNKAVSLKDADLSGAMQGLGEAKKEITLALAVQPQNQEVLNLQKQVEELGPQILKIFPVIDFPVWLDLGLVKDGFQADSLSLSHGKLLILDPNKKTLVSVDLKNKSHELLAGENNLGEAKFASLNGSIAWVFTDDKGLLKVEDKKVNVAVELDKDWGKIADIYGFAGNIYLLDEGNPSTGSGQIWKYLPITDGYSDKREYFKSGTKVDLNNTKSMEIDSSVWILKSGGEILKYTQGSPDYFSLSGLDKPLKDLNSFFVSDQTENLYLLDGQNNRLIVLDKKGVYKAQYQSGEFSKFTDLVVDEENKKVYLLEGSKIYVMDLK